MKQNVHIGLVDTRFKMVGIRDRTVDIGPGVTENKK